MQKLKIILQYKYLYVILALLVLIYSLIVTLIPNYKSKYKESDTNFTCKLEEYEIDGNKLELNLKCKENLIGTYYIKSEEEKKQYKDNLIIGSTLKIKGNLSVPSKNTIPYLFNYKEYLYNKKIYYILNIDEFKTVKEKTNIFYSIKNWAYKRANNIKHNDYIYAYILGKTYNIDEEVLESYRTNGISHLFALSGLHVGIFSLILLKILKKFKLKETLEYIITFLFLLFFSFITGFSPSILRASLLFFLLGINKIYGFNIKTINILLLVFCILTLINPFIIYNISFIMSFTTTFFIILGTDIVNDKNYIKGLLKVSALSFISNIGLSIYYFNYISPLGILLNLIFVPLVSFIIFPFTILVYVLPILSGLLNILAGLMESLSLILSKLMIKIYFPHISIIEALIFYIILFLMIKFKSKKYMMLLIILVIYWQIKPLLVSDTRIYFIDVGQGDSELIIMPHTSKSILIDTGGKISWNEEKWEERSNSYSIAEDSLIPLMRNLGIKKLDYLILTHGDYDHMGEAINLINNFKVEKVIFNIDEYNELETKLIKELEKKNIKYYKGIKELNIDKYKLQFLNTKTYDNENDNSNVIYFNLNNYKFLFMGDAGIEKENDILKKYNIKDLDVLKVGHHGSNTSSSEYFINSINPNYSIISVGKNNRYGHPKEEVLNILKKSKVYRTDIDGSIIFKIKNNKLNIEICVS